MKPETVTCPKCGIPFNPQYYERKHAAECFDETRRGQALERGKVKHLAEIDGWPLEDPEVFNYVDGGGVLWGKRYEAHYDGRE